MSMAELYPDFHIHLTITVSSGESSSLGVLHVTSTATATCFDVSDHCNRECMRL